MRTMMLIFSIFANTAEMSSGSSAFLSMLGDRAARAAPGDKGFWCESFRRTTLVVDMSICVDYSLAFFETVESEGGRDCPLPKMRRT